MKLTPKKIVAAIEAHKQELRDLEVKRLGLFGSFLKGNAKPGSDLDFLVTFKKPSFDNYMDLKFLLEKIFRKKVDLVTERSLKSDFKYVKKEAMYVSGI
jgi:predicted nucleotidyltransferase